MDPSAPSSGRVGRRFIVTGRVQGVGFRYFVVRQARELGLGGWTRNLPNGDVEVRAWGGEGALGQLAERLAAGPRSARVTKVDSSEISDAEDPGSSFHVIA